jgi:ATP-dependent exoDNAse (exonuclease V) beta subunit
MHKGRTGKYCVVWWDPSKLELDVRETMGLRQSKLLEADENQERTTHGKEAWEQWRDRRAIAILNGAVPTHTAETVTTLAKTTALPGVNEITIEETLRDPARPHGQRFGTLVHLTMLRVLLDATPNEVERVAAGEGRMLGADAAEIAAAASAVSAALETPLIRRAARSRDLRRECPVILPLQGTVIEGIADLVFLEEYAEDPFWTVVDFKTDAAIVPRLSEYRAQIAIYVRGISEATGLRADGVVLWM